jgi:hypothetical protein
VVNTRVSEVASETRQEGPQFETQNGIARLAALILGLSILILGILPGDLLSLAERAVAAIL